MSTMNEERWTIYEDPFGEQRANGPDLDNPQMTQNREEPRKSVKSEGVPVLFPNEDSARAEYEAGGLHPAVLPGGCLSPEVITRKLREGKTFIEREVP